MAGCEAATKALVKIKNKNDPAKNQLTWKWRDTVNTGDYGNPTAGTTYALCVYKDGATKIAEAQIESGMTWTASSLGFKYKASTPNSDGVSKVGLKEGTGSAKILVKAKGANLTVPAIPISPTTNVQLQLVRSGGTQCWESTFTAFTKDEAPSSRPRVRDWRSTLIPLTFQGEKMSAVRCHR